MPEPTTRKPPRATANPVANSGGSAARPATTIGGDQWPAQATDAIVDLVDKVAQKTTDPIQKVARAVVYGTFAAIVGIAAGVMSAILAVRLLNNYVVNHHVWAAEVIVGALFLAAAAFLWSKTTAPARD